MRSPPQHLGAVAYASVGWPRRSNVPQHPCRTSRVKVAERRDHCLYYNGHGDLAAEADGSGTRTALHTYDPFGAPLDAPPANGTSHRFTGAWDKQTDSTSGLVLMGARPYDSSLGRFLAVDPIDGGSLNNYDYAAQDPVNKRDLSGLVLEAQDGGTYLIPPAATPGPGRIEVAGNTGNGVPTVYQTARSGSVQNGHFVAITVQIDTQALGGASYDVDVSATCQGSGSCVVVGGSVTSGGSGILVATEYVFFTGEKVSVDVDVSTTVSIPSPNGTATGSFSYKLKFEFEAGG